MKYFTFAFLFSIIVIDLVGQKTFVWNESFKQGFIVPGNPVEPYFSHGDTADRVDTVKSVLTIVSHGDRGAFVMHLCHVIEPAAGTPPTWYVYLREGENDSWYITQPFFNINGLYKLHFLDSWTEEAFGELLITVTGLTLGFKSNSVMPTHGYGAYVAYTNIEGQPNRKPYAQWIRMKGGHSNPLK